MNIENYSEIIFFTPKKIPSKTKVKLKQLMVWLMVIVQHSVS